MGLDQLNRVGRHVGLLIAVPQGLDLAGGAGCVNGVATTVAGGADAFDDRVDAVVVPFGVLQALEHQCTQAFAQDSAVGIAIERTRVAARRKGRRLAEAHVHEDAVEGIQTAGDTHVRATGLKFHGCHIDGAQGTGAGSIYNAIGAAQVKAVGNTSGGNIAEQPREGIFLPGDVTSGDSLHHIICSFPVDTGISQRLAPQRVPEASAQGNDQFQGAGDTHDHRGAVTIKFATIAGFGAGGITGIQQRLAGHHHTQQLGGIGRLNVVRAETEQQGVKIDGAKKSATLGVGHIRCAGVSVEIIFGLPVAIGNLGNGIHTLANVGPELFDVGRLGEQAANADDCNWFHPERLSMISCCCGRTFRAAKGRTTPCCCK